MGATVVWDEGSEGRGLAVDAAEVARVCDLVLAREGVERPCIVSLTVADDELMAQINGQWRGVDAPTDVVSLECERPDDPDLAPGVPCELGDIVLDPAYLERQSRRFGTTAADETRLMLIHGMLHLLGYDHLEEDEARVMEALEDDILAEASEGRVAAVTLTRHRAGE